MQLRGLLYRKLTETIKTRKKEEKKIKRSIKKETKKAVTKIESFVTKDMKMIERNFNERFNQIKKDLKTLNKLNKSIIRQNRRLIRQLKKNG
jgi:hypothetical protein